MKNKLRLIFPQWQGGNNPLYPLGTDLLQWLAPSESGKTEYVRVSDTNKKLEKEEGILGKKDLLLQQQTAQELIDKHSPNAIVTFGGDCLVSLVPFAYLSEKYGDDFGILWIDSHPDVQTSETYENAHTYVLGNLVGNGDEAFSPFVKKAVKNGNVMIAGIHDPLPVEKERLNQLAIATLTPKQLKENPTAIQSWIETQKIKHLAIHIDLDILDVKEFRSILFAKPYRTDDEFNRVAEGEFTMQEVIEMVNAAKQKADIVGLTIAEHLPWDAYHLKNMLEALPLLGD